MVYLYKHVYCPHCGAEYAAMNEYNDFPKMHTVCTTCFMPMEIENPFYNQQQEMDKQ